MDVTTWYPENVVAIILPHHNIPAGTTVLRPGARGRVLWIRCWEDCVTGRPTVSIMAVFGDVWAGLWPHECRVVDGEPDPWSELVAGRPAGLQQMTLWE